MRFADIPDGTLTDPSVVLDGLGHWLMLAGLDAPDGTFRTLTLVSTDGQQWAQVIGSDISEHLASEDRPSALSLSTHNGAYWLHYARRRGARWSIAALASHGFVSWRHLEGGAPVLSRQASGFDRLYVHQPASASFGDLSDLVYVGSDGARDRLGLARRIGTEMGTF